MIKNIVFIFIAQCIMHTTALPMYVSFVSSRTTSRPEQLRNFFSHYNIPYDASNLNHTDSSGMTALMRAMTHQRDDVDLSEIITDLVECGADPNIAIGDCKACTTSNVFVVSVIACLFSTIAGLMRESTFSNRTTMDTILLGSMAGSAILAIGSLFYKGECTHDKKGYTALSLAIRSSHRASEKIQALCSSSPVQLDIRKEDYEHTLGTLTVSWRDGGPLNFEYGDSERYPLDEYRKKIRKNGQSNVIWKLKEFLDRDCSRLVAQYCADYPFAKEYPLPPEKLKLEKNEEFDQDECEIKSDITALMATKKRRKIVSNEL